MKTLLTPSALLRARSAFGLGALLLSLGACTLGSVAEGDSARSVEAALIEKVSCAAYPLAMVPAPGAESEIRGAFEALSPGAEVQYSPSRGTAQQVSNLEISLGTCPFGRSADAKARELIDAYPQAFRVDSSEWSSIYAPTCEQISPDGTQIYWTRDSFGGAPLRKDVFSVRLRRSGTRVWITSMTGQYVPPATSGMRTNMAACAKLDPEAAEASVRSSKLGYSTLDWCQPTGSGNYLPERRDALELRDDFWEWVEEPGQVRLQRVRLGALQVDGANYTPELITSDANCSSDGKNHIGFGLRYDSVRSTLSESHPGVDCIVCLH